MTSAHRPETGHVRLGDRIYAVERNWARRPDTVPTGVPSQVAVDSRGQVHWLQRTRPAVIVFDAGGGFVGTYGDAVFDGHGIHIDAEDRVFVTDRDAHQVIVFDAGGAEMLRLGTRHAPAWAAPFNHPTDVAVAPDGRIFVADGYGNACVHRFSADGAHEATWGSLGSAPGRFLTPHAVWAMADGAVLVADRENGRIQVFDPDGAFREQWTGLVNPMDIWVDDRGVVFVTDQVPSLLAFAPDGTLIGRCRPSLNGAHGIFGDAAGNLYLSEMNPASLTRMTRVDTP